MSDQIRRFDLPSLLISAALLTISLLLGIALANIKFLLGLSIAAGILIFIIAFVRTDIELYILIFAMLLLPEVIVAELGKAGPGARPEWEEEQLSISE